MATTQSEDPNERVAHPRHYNQSASGIECIELIEHLPCNLANAVKYIWRCGLKSTETPLRDLKSARWYTQRENERHRVFELDGKDWYEGKQKVEVVWRALAQRVIDKEEDGSVLREYLDSILCEESFESMVSVLDGAIQELEEKAGQ